MLLPALSWFWRAGYKLIVVVVVVVIVAAAAAIIIILIIIIAAFWIIKCISSKASRGLGEGKSVENKSKHTTAHGRSLHIHLPYMVY